MDRLDHLRDYLASHPGDRFAMYSVALELKKAGHFDEALAAFAALLQAHPTSGAGHYQLGLLWQEHGDEDEARAAWQAGLVALAGEEDVEARRSRSEIETAIYELD